MNKKQKILLLVGISLILLFILWTVLLTFVDVANVGPLNSRVGLSSVNSAFHRLTGVNVQLYAVTDWLGLLPIGIALGFAFLGLVQLIKRRSLIKVDKSILLLGGFYLAMIIIFVFFEKVIINYRPVLIEGVLEASYPSSTTLLFTTVMPTAAIDLSTRIKSKSAKSVCVLLILSVSTFCVFGRALSGVHWITDIIGGLLIGAGVDLVYCSLHDLIKKS